MKIRAKTNENIYVSSDQVVDRSAWRFGGGGLLVPGGPTAMLNDAGNMCCLGQVCHNSGFGKDMLLNKAYPKNVIADSEFLDIPGLAKFSSEPPGLFARNTDFAVGAARINDNPHLTLKGREKALKVYFKKYGFNLSFKGKYRADVLRHYTAA